MAIQEIDALLDQMNQLGGYPSSVLCNEKGLVLSAQGDTTRGRQFAGFSAFFDDVVARAGRYLDLEAIDEIVLRDEQSERFVVRTLFAGGQRYFLVVRVPRHATWRRHSNLVCRRLPALLDALASRHRTPSLEPA